VRGTLREEKRANDKSSSSLVYSCLVHPSEEAWRPGHTSPSPSRRRFNYFYSSLRQIRPFPSDPT
jgi:hypothetical protein